MKTRLFVGIATALSLTTAAHAVYLNPHGIGEALVYPYYTVNGGNSTLMSIVNTANDGKAVKVRFLEGMDGRDVLDVNVYLSPYDVWVVQAIEKDNGAAIFTNDNSCTVPKIPTSAVTAMPFSTASFDGSTAQLTDGGPTDISRTREGSIEIIEMGTIVNAAHHTLDAITHADGVPANCAQIVAAWDDYWKTEPGSDMTSPTGGLFGSGTILNVELGTVELYNAEAIARFYEPGSPQQHTAPDALGPNLSTGTSFTSIVVTDNGAVTTSFAHSIDAVSTLFMVDELKNEFWTSTTIAATSEWVLSYPTKRFYTDWTLDGNQVEGLPPFEHGFGSGAPTSCANAEKESFSREEQVTLPNGPQYVPTCYTTVVVTFGQFLQPEAGDVSQVLGSILFTRFEQRDGPGLPGQNGWANVNFVTIGGHPYTRHRLTGTNGNIFYGLPVIGFSVSQFVNGNVGGLLSNYTALAPHKSHVRCDRGDATLPCS